ncbi:uncharacterized protein [Centruroides vittatus]|uniref:uncharacterized protein n=1 Tax=Centruroides vittatus TaxID=120091 RepID=UPI00350FE4B6
MEKLFNLKLTKDDLFRKNYTLMPSLEHRTFVKIAITSWNQGDIRALASKFYFSSPILNIGKRKKEWPKVEDEVIKRVLKLSLPKSLKEELSSFVEAVGWQILTWIDFHNKRCNFVINLPNEFFWTPEDAIDKEKTSQMLVQDKNLDIVGRYRLACTYCLEDHIFILWNQLSGKKLYGKDLRNIRINKSPLVSFWSHDIEGEIVQLGDIMKRYCQDESVIPCNKAATRYFLKKLTSDEGKKRVLVKTAGYVANRRCDSARNRTDFPKEHYADVLCFLLSQMDEEQQTEVFKSYPYKVLKCFLDWPWQSLFMETANHMWDFLSEGKYDLLLRIIVDKVINGYKDCNYQNRFGEFWQQNLFKVEDKENVRLILKNATVKEKEEIIFYYKGQNICERLIYNNEWGSLKFFVQECISSKDIKVKFKEEFKERIIRRRSEETLEKEKDMWSKFFQLIDDLIQKIFKKRNIEKGNSSPNKRLCSIEFKEVAHNMKKICEKMPKSSDPGRLVEFAEKFDLLLYETPRIGSTADPEFFMHGILGLVLTLSDSGLVEKLDGRKQVALRVLTNDQITSDLGSGYYYNDDELKDIAKKLDKRR